MTQTRASLIDLLQDDTVIDVVDIGANPIDGDPPYKNLLQSGNARLVGFEPQPEALEKLNAAKGEHERYLPNAVFDGNEHELKVCKAQGMTSLLEPNAELLAHFHGFPEWGQVVNRIPVSTVRLDDVDEIENIDYLKIDIQGGELEVFRNGVETLKDCLVIQTEAEFLPMYKDQPLFSEVEMFLRSQGFLFHRVDALQSRALQPMLINSDIYRGISQVFWTDAIFVKDFTKFDELSVTKLKKLAMILHDIYGSFDVALRALMACDEKSESSYAQGYPQFLSQSQQ